MKYPLERSEKGGYKVGHLLFHATCHLHIVAEYEKAAKKIDAIISLHLVSSHS